MTRKMDSMWGPSTDATLRGEREDSNSDIETVIEAVMYGR